MYKILLLSLLSLLSSSYSAPILLAYIPSWVTKYGSSCNLNLDNLNVNYFTHLTIPFVSFDTTNFAVSAMNNDDTSGWYTQVKGLKSRNADLKVLISVGGGSFGGDPWAEMIKTSANRNKFITNIISFSRSNSFDGIDIDWEAPSSTTQTVGIKSFFSELRSAVANDATSSGKPALLLTIASPNYKDAIDIFNFADTHQYLDWINVMSYDYYGDWSTVVGANTAFSGNNNLDITSTISYFGGVPSSKLIMGFANYARTFILSSSNNHSPGSSFSSVGSPGPCTSSPGTLSYSELYPFLSSLSGGTYVVDPVSKTPYFYSGTQWVTYDDKQSLQIKMDYINNNGLGGAMVWALDGNSSLTDFIAKELGTSSSSTLTTSPCTTTGDNDSSASVIGASYFVFVVFLISIL